MPFCERDHFAPTKRKNVDKLSIQEATNDNWWTKFSNMAQRNFLEQLWQKALAPFVPGSNRNYYCRYIYMYNIYETTLLHCYKIIQILLSEMSELSTITCQCRERERERDREGSTTVGQFHFIGSTLIGAAVSDYKRCLYWNDVQINLRKDKNISE